jgi:rubrerythrin
MISNALTEIDKSIEDSAKSEAAYDDLRKRFRQAYSEEKRHEIVYSYALKQLTSVEVFNYDILERFFLLRNK